MKDPEQPLSGRTQPAALLNVAPASNSMISPQFAAAMAAWMSPPDAIEITSAFASTVAMNPATNIANRILTSLAWAPFLPSRVQIEAIGGIPAVRRRIDR